MLPYSLWNIYIIISIVWFIRCIELTIINNHIEGVDSIQETDPGQLIPFIIGFVNMVQVLKKVVLVGLAKVCTILTRMILADVLTFGRYILTGVM